MRIHKSMEELNMVEKFLAKGDEIKFKITLEDDEGEKKDYYMKGK